MSSKQYCLQKHFDTLLQSIFDMQIRLNPQKTEGHHHGFVSCGRKAMIIGCFFLAI